MTEQITLGIKGRGQNPEKDDVIKSTDIFEKDSLVPGQEPTLREDLTLTVEPEPTVTSNVAQTATTFTEDTMKDAISLENHLWGTKLSLETALESLKETTDEFEKLNLAKENHQATTTEQFALESIGQRMKAGLNRVIEFLKNLWKRLIAWVKGERGQSAEEKIQRAQEAVKKNDAREAAIDRFMEQAFEEIFGEEDSAAPFAKAAAFKAKADDVQDDLDKKINDLNDSLKDTAASVNKFAETTSKVQEMVDEAKKVNEILKEATAILEEPHKPVKDAKDLYKKLRKEYGKEGSPNASARVRDMEKRLSTIEDISKAIEKDELTPEAGGAMAEALRAAAKAAKFEEERIRAESIIAETIIRIEKEIAKGAPGTEGVAKEDLVESIEDSVETDTVPETIEDADAVSDAEGTEDPGFEPPASPEDLPQQEDTSLNDPEYLEGEHEGQTEEETLQVIEERAEDLAVAAEALKAQTTVLNKLKANKVISVGFVTESIQTLGENLFKDPRYYTQLPSRTNYDYSVESLGEKIKTGAKNLKDRIVALIKRFWKWFMGLIGNTEKQVEDIKTKTDADMSDIEETVREATDQDPGIADQSIIAKEANNDVVATYQLLGMNSAKNPEDSFNLTMSGLKESERVCARMKELTDEFIKAVRGDNESEAVATVGELSELARATKEDEIPTFKTRESSIQKLTSALQAKATVRTLTEASRLIEELNKTIIKALERQNSISKSVFNVDPLDRLLDDIDPENPGKYLSLIQTVINARTAISVFSNRVNKQAILSLNTYFDLSKIKTIIRSEINKALKDKHGIKSKDTPANESLRTNSRRKPYWER